MGSFRFREKQRCANDSGTNKALQRCYYNNSSSITTGGNRDSERNGRGGKAVTGKAMGKATGKATTVKAERECGVSKISEVGIASAIKRSREQRRKER